MDEPRFSYVSNRVYAAAERLRIDAAAAEILQAFAAAGVESLLVKGRSHSEWLYEPDEPRSYVDADLLVRPGQERAAGEVLGVLGFRRTREDTTLPEWWREHSLEWVRATDGVVVDLHRTLPGVDASAEAAWSLLSAAPETISIAGHSAPTLSEPARALHVSLHAAQHGMGRSRSRSDLERALGQVDESTWRAAAALAEQLDAIEWFAAGLRLRPEGARLADRLGLPAVASVDVTLRTTASPPVALGFDQLARAGGVRLRTAIVWRKLVPPRAFMLHWDPRAAESRRALVAAYVRRPFWILRHAPRGFIAWRRARRDTAARR